MTTDEARDQVREALTQRIPDLHYVSATKYNVWSTSGPFCTYRVSIQPGLDGSVCQGFEEDSLEAAVSACLNWTPKPKAIPNNE